jgi:hypothetical protein
VEVKVSNLERITSIIGLHLMCQRLLKRLQVECVSAEGVCPRPALIQMYMRAADLAQRLMAGSNEYRCAKDVPQVLTVREATVLKTLVKENALMIKSFAPPKPKVSKRKMTEEEFACLSKSLAPKVGRVNKHVQID